MSKLSDIVNNKNFILGFGSNLLSEWSRPQSSATGDIPPLKKPTNEGRPDTVIPKSYNFSPYVKSVRKRGTMKVYFLTGGGVKAKIVWFYYSDAESGGEGGAGYLGTSKDGVMIYASGDGGYDSVKKEYTAGGRGAKYVHDIFKKYECPAPPRNSNSRDAYVVHYDPDDGYREFIPNYFFGRGTSISIKPGTKLYIYGGSGEKELKGAYLKGYEVAFGGGTDGHALGFEFDDSVADLDLRGIEIVNGQSPLISSGPFDPRVYLDPSYNYMSNINFYCSGGRCCYIMMNSGNTTNEQVMLACAGGGGGAHMTAKDYSKVQKEILNSVDIANKETANELRERANRLKPASVSLSNVRSFSFVGGSGGLDLSISMNGDIDTDNRVISRTLECELRVVIDISLTNLKKYSKTTTYIKDISSGTTYLNDILNLNTLFEEFGLSYSDKLSEVTVSVYSSIPLIIYEGCFGVSLVDYSTADTIANFTYGEPTVNYHNMYNDICFNELLDINLIRGKRELDIKIDDYLCYTETLKVVSTAKPKEPNTETLGVGEILDFKIRRG